MSTELYSKNRVFIVSILAVFLFLFIFLSSYDYPLSFYILSLSLFVFFFFLRPLIGLYFIIFFLPLVGLNFHFNFLEIPFIDFLSLVVLVSFALQQFYISFFEKKKEKLKFPFGLAFFLFFFFVLLSSFFSDIFFESFWYSFRWILFFYLAFIVLPFNLVKNLKVLKNALLLLALSGLLLSLVGLSSLFFQDLQDSFFRVRPLSFFGEWIFGKNFNLLSEFLVISVFVIFSLKYYYQSLRSKRFLDILAVFILLVNLMTFGRTAWITIFLQLILYFSIYNLVIKKEEVKVKKVLISIFLLVVLISPFFLRMMSLQEHNVSSTKNRLLLAEISWQAFLERPLLGHGSGSFLNLVSDDTRFVAQYGDPLDSHGFGQKILSENGILGVLSFLLFLILIFKHMYLSLIANKEDYRLLLPLFVASFGAYFYQIFNTSYYKARIWVPIALTLAAIEIVNRKNEKEKKYEKKD
jgi:O-antigen ligase